MKALTDPSYLKFGSRQLVDDEALQKFLLQKAKEYQAREELDDSQFAFRCGIKKPMLSCFLAGKTNMRLGNFQILWIFLYEKGMISDEDWVADDALSGSVSEWYVKEIKNENGMLVAVEVSCGQTEKFSLHGDALTLYTKKKKAMSSAKKDGVPSELIKLSAATNAFSHSLNQTI